eukprot:779207-Prymnesium_polylepis.1
MERPDDRRGVRDRGVALGQAVEGARIVDVVDDVAPLEGLGGKGEVRGHRPEELELANHGLAPSEEREVIKSDAGPRGINEAAGERARHGVARREPHHKADASTPGATLPHGVRPDDHGEAGGGLGDGAEGDGARREEAEDRREEVEGGEEGSRDRDPPAAAADEAERPKNSAARPGPLADGVEEELELAPEGGRLGVGNEARREDRRNGAE